MNKQFGGRLLYSMIAPKRLEGLKRTDWIIWSRHRLRLINEPAEYDNRTLLLINETVAEFYVTTGPSIQAVEYATWPSGSLRFHVHKW